MASKSKSESGTPSDEQISFYEHEIARLTPARNEYQLFLRKKYERQLQHCRQSSAHKQQ